MGLFADWQPVYADVGLATFPVDTAKKKPAVSNYQRMGRAASSALIRKYGDADAFGFACQRAALTVVDVDTDDERVLADCLSALGPTPLVARTPSGGFHAYYRNNGEPRSPRKLAKSWGLGDCVDILGAGLCMAPPSRSHKGAYGFIEGDLGDLAHLPKMRAVVPANDDPQPNVTQRNGAACAGKGQRNVSLWRASMRRIKEAPAGTLKLFMGEVAALNRDLCDPPLPDDEVARIASSAWEITEAGNNWAGSGRRLVLNMDETQEHIVRDPDGFLLLNYLRCQHRADASFFVANAMHQKMGLSLVRFRNARARLVKEGWLVVDRQWSRQENTSWQLRFGPPLSAARAAGAV